MGARWVVLSGRSLHSASHPPLVSHGKDGGPLGRLVSSSLSLVPVLISCRRSSCPQQPGTKENENQHATHSTTAAVPLDNLWTGKPDKESAGCALAESGAAIDVTGYVVPSWHFTARGLAGARDTVDNCARMVETRALRTVALVQCTLLLAGHVELNERNENRFSMQLCPSLYIYPGSHLAQQASHHTPHRGHKGMTGPIVDGT